MQNKRMVVIPLMLIMALSILGFAYATWSDKVTITGKAEMGTVAIVFTEFSCLEKYEDPAAPGTYLNGEWLGKDVGKVKCSMEEFYEDPHTLKTGYKKAVVEITYAYPSYRVHMVFALKNVGNIPVHIKGVDIKDPTGALKFEDLGGGEGVLYEDLNGNDVCDVGEERINTDIVNLVCLQLHPCVDTKAEVDLHFKQEAEQCHTYYFEVTIEAVQWNKYP